QATAATTENNKGQQFGRQTTAKAYRGEDQKGEEPDEGEEGDDQTGYETAAESEGDEGSESDDEYEDASECRTRTFSEGYEMTAQREKRTHRKLGEVSVLPQVDRQQRGKWSSRRDRQTEGGFCEKLSTPVSGMETSLIGSLAAAMLRPSGSSSAMWEARGSAASQHVNLLGESLEVEEAHDVSSPEAAAATTAARDGGDGEGALQQVLSQGLGPVNAEWIRGSGKKFGWHTLGSAAAVVLLAVFVTASMFAAAGRKSKAEEVSRAGREEKPAPEHLRQEEEQQEGTQEQEKGKTEKKAKEQGEDEEKEETEKEKAEAEEEEEEGGEAEQEGGEEKYQYEGGEDEFDEESGTAQVALLRRLQRCVSPAASLAASLNKPESTVLLEKLKKHLETAVEYQSDAVAGEPAAVAALAAANKGAALAFADVQMIARDVLAADARTLVEFPEAQGTADAGYGPTFETPTEVPRFLEVACSRAVDVCDTTIGFLREDGVGILEKSKDVSSQSQRMVLPSALGLSAMRFAVETIRGCAERQEAAMEAAKQLQQIPLKLSKNSQLVELEYQTKHLGTQEKISAVMLQVAHLVEKTRAMSPEEVQLLGEWDQMYKSGQEALVSAQQKLQLLKGETSVVDAMVAAEEAEMAGVHAATIFKDLLSGLFEFLPRQARVGPSQILKVLLRLPDFVSTGKNIMGLTTAMKPIAEAVAGMEQQVREVGHKVEMQLSGLKELQWVPKWLLENVGKRLKSVLDNTKVKGKAIHELMAQMENTPSVVLESADALGDDAIAVVDHFKAMLELNAEVEILALLKGIVANAETTKTTALAVIAADTSMQPAERQLADKLKNQLEYAVTVAGKAVGFSSLLDALHEYVIASEKLFKLAVISKLEGMLKSDPAAAKELQETDAAKGKLQTATAKVAKGSDLQQGKAPVQATAETTENNKGQQFGRQTTAKAYRGEDQKGEEPDEGEEGDDQTGYETAAESEGDEGSESDDEYEDASEWVVANFRQRTPRSAEDKASRAHNKNESDVGQKDDDGAPMDAVDWCIGSRAAKE
ncbi:hypothetical protein EMWEY_00058250, partial [Eimeria maxima]